MSKNYFTDSQIKEIYYYEAGGSIEIGALEFYRSLFNKAVEVAIGEPKAYLVDGRIEQGLFFDKNSAISMVNANCGEFKSLHTVQELDN